MNQADPPTGFRPGRTLIIGLVSTLVVLGLALVIVVVQQSQHLAQPAHADIVLASSSDTCVNCHQNTTPGIIEQFDRSTMAAAKVACRDCHEVKQGSPGAIEHEGSYILSHPTPAKCQKCHVAETAQFMQSRHSLPAWVAFEGSKTLTPQLMAEYQAVPEGQFSPTKDTNAIAVLEGQDITQLACKTCHSVGQPQPDGSVGDCAKCHLTHEFSLAQARKPETCSTCHIGPDHPQWEIYQESPHGIAYSTGGQTWNWDAAPGTIKVADFPAPTCATCHFSGFGANGTTHDVGDRLTWFLFSSISERRPVWQDNKVHMQSVCQECHDQNFVNDYYQKADTTTLAVNTLVQQSNDIMANLNKQNLLTSDPYDQSIEFNAFELWHHFGRTAKFGAWMQGADYTQWHGAYEIEKNLVDLREQAAQMLKQAGLGN
jgi:hydroxylamine dehydrogenase